MTTRSVAFAVPLAALLITACGSSHHPTTTSSARSTVASATQSKSAAPTATTAMTFTRTIKNDPNCGPDHIDYGMAAKCTPAKHKPPRAHRVPHRVAATSTTTTQTTTSTTVATTTKAPATKPHTSGYSTAAVESAVDKLVTVDSDSSRDGLTADFKRLGGKCRETPYHLASELYNSEQDLHKNGVSEDSEDIADHLVTVASGLGKAATPTSCAALLAAYLVLREQ